MTTMEPTPEQFTEWLQEAIKDGVAGKIGVVCEKVARFAYAAGADGELEACVQWLDAENAWANGAAKLRAARRPKPPSLKQQAFKVLSVLSHQMDSKDLDVLTKALAALPDD